MKDNQMKELFRDISKHLLVDDKPSIYLKEISTDTLFTQYPFSMIYRLKETDQSKVHHKEGNVFNHTMLVVDEAAKVRQKSMDKSAFMWSALLHDIGKPDTTKIRKGKITSYEHDKVGAKLTRDFLVYFECEESFISHVQNLVLYHMHILYVLKDLPFSNIKEMIKNVDINELALLGLCDRVGRFGGDRKAEEENIKTFLDKLNLKK
jgi:putative nucleotidyltransferase with HDIG domain